MPPWSRPRWADEPTMLTLGTVGEALTGQAYPFLDQVVTDGAIDSRLAIPGSLFVALPGERTDGHDHVGAAFERGALAALVERDLTGPWTTLDLSTPPNEAQARAARPPLCIRVPSTLLELQSIAGHWRGGGNPAVEGLHSRRRRRS